MLNTLTIDGQRLHYITAGKPGKPLILMVHGWSSSSLVWKNALAALQDDYYCVAVDLLGFGQSDKPKRADYSIQAQARRILAFADHFNAQQFSLMGHSMGGQVILCLASMLAPERVTQLVDVAGVASGKLTPIIENRTYPGVHWGYRLPILYPLMRPFSAWKPAVRYIFGMRYYNLDAIPREQWLEDVRTAWLPGMAASMYWSGEAIHQLDLTPHLAAIQAKTLIIFGKHDNVVPVSEAHLVHEHVPDSHLIVLDECGHMVMHTQPEAYLAALRDFFGVTVTATGTP